MPHAIATRTPILPAGGALLKILLSWFRRSSAALTGARPGAFRRWLLVPALVIGAMGWILQADAAPVQVSTAGVAPPSAINSSTGYAGLLTDDDDETPEPPTPTSTPDLNDPDILSATPTHTPFPILMTTVQGRFFANAWEGCFFNATAATPPAFSLSFPVIAFNPPSSVSLVCVPPTPVNEITRPFTDVIPPTPPPNVCDTRPARVGGVPTASAGEGSLYTFQAVFTGQLYAPETGPVTFNFWADDGWTLALGPKVGGVGTPVQPYYVTGAFNPSPTPATTPWSVFEHYHIVGRYDGPSSPSQRQVTVAFPEAGYYPFEVDYTECRGGGLLL